MLPRSFVLCGACVSATGRRSFVLPRSCLVVRGPATLPLVASEREGLGPWGCPRSLSSAGSHGTPAARGAASAAPPVASGSATRRRRARAGPFGVQRAGSFLFLTGFVDCGRLFSRRQTHVYRPVWTAFRPASRRQSCFALAHCESCTAAPRRVAVELKASRHDSASISKVLKSCCGPRVEWSTTGGVQAAST